MVFFRKGSEALAPQPWARGGSALLAVVGVFLCGSLAALAAFWGALLVLLLIAGETPAHGRFLLLVCLPMFIGLVLIWVVAAPAPPGGELPAWQFTAMTALRIAAFGGVFQLCFLPLIRRGRLVQTLRAWRLRGNALLVAVASLTLLDDLHYRLNQVIHARIARGMANEGVLNRVTQLPALLRPLVVLVLTSGIKRAELWAHRGLRQRLQQMGETSSLGSLPTSFGLILGALVWLVVALRL